MKRWNLNLRSTRRRRSTRSVLFVACTAPFFAQVNCSFGSPIGFGAGTTGGNPLNVCHATNLASLKACAKSPVSTFVQLVGNPTIPLGGRRSGARNVQ